MNALITDENQPWLPGGTSGRFAPVFAIESFRPGDFEGRFAIEEWAPRIDRRENECELLLQAAVPEMKRLEVRISEEDGALTISGERRFEAKEQAGGSRREYGHFWRSFVIPERTRGATVSAAFADGVLQVRVPKGAPTGSDDEPAGVADAPGAGTGAGDRPD